MPVSRAPSSGAVIAFLSVMAILMVLDIAAVVYACVGDSL
jgi:hypothetical protein